MKIAIAGKGGVGKTVIASGIAWSLARAGYTTLAIDADSSPNLALPLGLSQEEAARIVPVLENDELIKIKTGTGFSGVVQPELFRRRYRQGFFDTDPCRRTSAGHGRGKVDGIGMRMCRQ